MNHHEVLLNNTRAHWEMRDMWSLDTNQDVYEDWDKAKLKVLLVILTTYEVKAVSNTYSCVATLMKDSMKEWTDMFIDASFYPSDPMMDTLTSLGIPVMTGISSHRDWRDYDIVAISHSISLEALNVPHIYAHSNFPFAHEERFSDPNCPIVIYGGSASTTMFPALGGPIRGHGKSMYDIGCLGMGEPILPELFKFLYAFHQGHSIKANKDLLINQLLDQEIFRTRLIYPFLYNISHAKGKITSIERLDPRIPEKVKLNRIHFPNFKGFYRKYFAPNGVACERHDVQIASGCSSFCCSFCATGDTKLQTPQGVKFIKDIQVGDKVWDRTKFVNVTRWFDMGIKPVIQIRTHLNHIVKVTPDHKIKLFDGDSIVWRKAGDITVGDQIPLSMKGGFCQTLDLSLNECILIGLLVGDGYYDYNRIRFCVNEEESKPLVRLLNIEGISYRHSIQIRNVQRFDIKQGRGHKLYTRWGLSNYTKDGKTKPSVIDQMSESQLKAFFCGLFSADGTVDKYGAISVSTKYKWLAECTQYNLLRLGIITSYSVDHRIRKANDRYGFKEQEKTIYRVFIKTKDSREKFTREIGFIHPHKQEKIEGIDIQSNGNWTFSCSRELRKLIIKTGEIHSGSKNVSISSIRKVYNKGIKIADTIIDENLFIDYVEEVISLPPEKVYDITVDDPEHLFVGNSALYSNCAEGQEGGHYTEKPIEEIEQDILKSKCYSAANNYNAFSFNCNYYSQYFDMLKLFITHSSSTSIFNQRADVLGNSPDYVAAARKMGVMKISTACEGISERIRQNVLNKNLPRKTLLQACRNVFIQKMLGLKFTMILTGLETQEDLEDFYSTIDEIMRIRTECRSNTKLSLTFTPLLYYIQTPFRYVKRTTSKMSWEHTRILMEMIPFLMNKGIKLKFYGSGITTYFEQLVIDAGWQSTNILKDLALEYNVDYTRGILDSAQPHVKEILDKYDIPHDFFFDGFDPDKDILPNDMLEFTTPKKLEEWKEMYKKNDYYHPLCLRTAANMNAKCFNCGACSTVEEKKMVFARSLNDKSDLYSVLAAMTKAKPKSVLRFVVKQYPLFAFYSKEMLSHYITSQFIRRDALIQKAYYHIGFNSTTWVSEYFQKPMYSGLFIYDVEFKMPVSASYVLKYKDEVNSVLKTCKIIDVFDEDVNDEVIKSDMQMYLCKVPFFTPNSLRERLLSFDWQVKIAQKAFPTVKYVKQDFSKYKDSILFKGIGSTVVMAMALPIIYNPFSIIQAITKKPLDYCIMNADVQIVDTGKQLDVACRCGNTLYYSLTNNKVIKDCPICRLKKILSVVK